MNLGTALSSWEAGEPCEKHEIGFCGSCREQANIVRRSDGSLQYDNDCAVQSYAEITGATYTEALEAMQAAGFRPTRGTPGQGVLKAFEDSGFKVTRTALDQRSAQAYSRQGRTFLVVGKDRRGGHAWTIVEGKINRPLGPGARYVIAEIA